MKKSTTEHEPITSANIHTVAIAAAYVAIKRAYLATAHTVKDNNGNVLDYDGNSGGAEMVRKLYNGFTSATTTARANIDKAMAAYDENQNKSTLATYVESIKLYVDTSSNDSDDCIQTAALSLVESIDENNDTPPESAFIDAVRAVHAYIYSMDKNTGNRVRRKYDENGRLLAINDYQYIKYPHLYINSFDENAGDFQIVDVNDGIAKYCNQADNNDVIRKAFELMTITEKRIVQYVADGYTYETIAKRLNITTSNVKVKVHRIRAKVASAGIKLPE